MFDPTESFKCFKIFCTVYQISSIVTVQSTSFFWLDLGYCFGEVLISFPPEVFYYVEDRTDWGQRWNADLKHPEIYC